jgi:hypothetical protein
MGGGKGLDEQRTTLAAEIAAELELSLDEAAATLEAKLRESQRLRGELSALGLIRDLPKLSAPPVLDVLGLAVGSQTLPAFGGLLYGTAAHAHRLRLDGPTILQASEQVQVRLGDLDFYETTQRLRWKRMQHAYELLETLLEQRDRPHLALLDVPIFVSRGEDRNREQIEDVEEEWIAMLDVVNGFWSRRMTHLAPSRDGGMVIASVQRQNALSLFTALHNNPETSPDEIALELPHFVRAQWRQLRRAGMSRLLELMLHGRTRTIAYSFEDINIEPRWEPQALHHSGILGFFMRASARTPIWQVQVAGHRSQWTSTQLDDVALSITQATLNDGGNAEPLPLWYARRLAAFPDSALVVFRELVQERLGGTGMRGTDEA